ncbi:S26 family signal peptidase [Streptomyces scopuliridis]|uniref:S26 family signal peptidase n=1 Tax=Streptomyces scopuliridis TaxID=452529 RepID=UPI003413B1EF
MALHALLRRRLVVVTVRGASMEPVYHDGDRVLVDRRTLLAAGKVVVVERPVADATRFVPPPPLLKSSGAVSGRHWLIKRIAGVPGTPVPRSGFPALAATGGHVPPGKLILTGDNAPQSLDSRQLGFFPADRVLGTVVCRFPPSQRMS